AVPEKSAAPALSAAAWRARRSPGDISGSGRPETKSRVDLLELRRPEEVSPEARVADARIADHVHDRGLPARHRARERRSNVVGLRHVLPVTADRLEHPVVTEIGKHIEGVDPTLQHRHLVEARSPGAVVPEDDDEGQPVLERRLELHRADAEAAVPDDDDHLLSRTSELRPDPHADAMPDGGQGSRVDDLAGEARTEALREPSRQREAVDHESGIVVHGG